MIYRYYAFSFFKDCAFFAAVLVPFFTQWGELTLFQVQLIESWFMLWFVVLEVPTGAVADYIGRKHSMVLGAFVVAGAALLYGSIPHVAIFLISEFFFALAMALISGADEAFLYDTLKEQGREKEIVPITGKAHMFRMLGLLIAAPIGGVIAARFGLNAPLLFTTGSYVIAGCIGLSFREPRRFTKQSESLRYIDALVGGLSYFVRHKTIRLLAFDAVIANAAGYFVIWLYQPLLIKQGVSVQFFGVIHMVLVGTQMIIASHFHSFEKLFGSATNFMRVSAFITGALFVMVALYPHVVTIVVFAALAGGFGLTRITYITTQIQHFIPSDKRATVLSSLSMFRTFLLAALNPIVGYAASKSLPIALLLVAIFPLFMVFFSPVKKGMLELQKINPA